MRKMAIAKGALALGIIAALALPAICFANNATTPTAEHANQEPGISKSQAADIAKAKLGGKVLKVEEIDKNGSPVYRVKLLLQGGRIKIVSVKSSNGEIM